MCLTFYTYGDMHTFVSDNADKVFRYWVYKRMFTPLEVEKKYVDQSEFEDTTASFGIIRYLVELPNGDFLIGFSPVYDDEVSQDVDYHRLSDIHMCMCDCDQYHREEC